MPSPMRNLLSPELEKMPLEKLIKLLPEDIQERAWEFALNGSCNFPTEEEQLLLRAIREALLRWRYRSLH